jgi:hypothetical protein
MENIFIALHYDFDAIRYHFLQDLCQKEGVHSNINGWFGFMYSQK